MKLAKEGKGKARMTHDRKKATLVGILLLLAYSMLAGEITDTKWAVMLFDIISGAAVISIALIFYPYFKSLGKIIPKIYLGLKYLEGALMIAAGIAFLWSSSVRTTIYEHPQTLIFIISAFFFYYLLYVSRLVPRFISIWGVIGVAILLLSNSLGLANINVPVLEYFASLIILNEIFLAIWLMVKGFNLQK